MALKYILETYLYQGVRIAVSNAILQASKSRLVVSLEVPLICKAHACAAVRLHLLHVRGLQVVVWEEHAAAGRPSASPLRPGGIPATTQMAWHIQGAYLNGDKGMT